MPKVTVGVVLVGEENGKLRLEIALLRSFVRIAPPMEHNKQVSQQVGILQMNLRTIRADSKRARLVLSKHKCVNPDRNILCVFFATRGLDQFDFHVLVQFTRAYADFKSVPQVIVHFF